MHEWFDGLAGLAGATVIRQWMRTLDYKVYYHDPAVDPAQRGCRGRKIYLFWHEYILFPLYLRGNCNLTMLLSRHRDAEILARMAYHLGFECVRGSTYRGASTAVRQLCRRSRSMHLTVTPDGPRGPRRRLAQGPIYLASKLGLPLVVMGFGFDRPWRARSWDRFAVPRPFSRARAVVSREIHVPPDIDRRATEAYRQSVERTLNLLTDQAERWAESGRSLQGQRPLCKESRFLEWGSAGDLEYLGAAKRKPVHMAVQCDPEPREGRGKAASPRPSKTQGVPPDRAADRGRAA